MVGIGKPANFVILDPKNTRHTLWTDLVPWKYGWDKISDSVGLFHHFWHHFVVFDQKPEAWIINIFLTSRKVTKLSHVKENPFVWLRVAKGRFHLENNLLIDEHCADTHRVFRETICQTQITVEGLKDSVHHQVLLENDWICTLLILEVFTRQMIPKINISNNRDSIPSWRGYCFRKMESSTRLWIEKKGRKLLSYLGGFLRLLAWVLPKCW